MVAGKIDLKPANTKAIIIYIIFSLIFLGVGILCFILFLKTTIPGLSPAQTFGEWISNAFNDLIILMNSSWTITQYWWILVILVVGLLVVGFLVGWLLLFLVAKLGNILVYVGCILYVVGAVVGSILVALIYPLAIIGMAIPAVLLIIAVFTNFNRLKRAGEFLKFTGQVILAEKGMLVAPILLIGISITNFFTFGSIFAYLVVVFYEGSYVWVGYVLASIASLVQLIIYYGIFYVTESINTTFAYEWYRKRDPTMKFCVKNVAGNFGPIFTFGVVTAIVSWIQQTSRNVASGAQGKGGAALIFFAIFARIIASIIGFVYKYLTYFTLPAIVVESLSFKKGVTRSFDLLKRYYMDVIIRETGVERAMGIVQWISIFIYGILGVIVGITIHEASTLDWTSAMLMSVLPAVIFANIPTFFIFRPMKTAYLTFIYGYAQDEESNFQLPTRIPAELRGDLKETTKTMDTSKSIVNLYKT